MITADLYLNRMQWLPYLREEECRSTGAEGCEDFLVRLQNGTLSLDDCKGLSAKKRANLKLALTAGEWLPPVEALMMPQAVAPGLVAINEPGDQAPVLVSGNNEMTQTLMTAVLATTTNPFYLLMIDCLGHTVDMAVVYEAFTGTKLAAALQEAELAARVSHRRLILPGLCASLQDDLAAATGWKMVVGPICAAELPLFCGDLW